MEHSNEENPDMMTELQKYDDVTSILAQMESEKAAKLALQRIDETRRESTAFDALHTPRASARHGEAVGPVPDADAVSQYSMAEGSSRAEGRDVEVEATLRRSSRSGPKNNTASSSQPTLEAPASRPERGRAKKRRRVA